MALRASGQVIILVFECCIYKVIFPSYFNNSKFSPIFLFKFKDFQNLKSRHFLQVKHKLYHGSNLSCHPKIGRFYVDLSQTNKQKQTGKLNVYIDK